MEIRKLTKAMLYMGAAWAATAGASMAQEEGHVSVRDRARPEYDALGIHAGGFTVFPTLNAGVLFNDNIFSTPAPKDDDTVFTVSPAVRFASNWGVHALNLSASADSRFYDKFTSQNSTDWRLGADGRLDVTRGANFNGGVSYFNGVEPLYENPTTGIAEPIQYQLFTARGGGEWSFVRTKFSASVQNDSFDYDDGVLFNGTSVDEDFRDGNVTTATGRVDYTVGPDTAVFLSGSENWRDYDLAPPAVAVNRNSNGYQVLVGVNFGVTRLLTGDFGVGYMSQSYDQPGISDDNGMALNAHLRWFPTELVTVTAAGRRYVGDSGLAGVASSVNTDASLTADYELLRNVILTAEGAWYKEEFTGLDRDDNRWRGSFSGDYLMNRVVALYARYDHWDQDSSGTAAGREYQVNNISVGVRLRR